MRNFVALMIALILVSAPVSAQAVLGSYTAWIGQHDVFNSRGQRLTTPAQIIRQDRANYHRFNLRDSGDGGDPWFANANARASLERAVQALRLTAGQRNMIVQGGVWVQLELHGWSGQRITDAYLSVWR